MKTYSAKPLEVERKWHLIDADGQTLGTNVDTGDFVIIINAEKIKVSGTKETDKIYYHHTGYPGGLRAASFKELMEKDPRMPIEKAIKGMLPKNTLGAQQFTKLKVYVGDKHNHEAQKPVKYEFKGENK